MSIDFITKLPKSKDPVTGITYDLIMVIVDRFTKYLIAVPFKETHTAEQLGHLLLDRLVRDHGVLIMIITDRDKLFTSNYWKTISAAMGTKPKMSTAYHPQTDSQTEQANQVLETYLQHYINQTHSNWVQLLLVAQLAINQHRSDSTKESLFFANFRQHANIRMPSRASPNMEKALQHDKLLQQTHTMMRHYLQETSERMQHQIDKKSKIAPQLKKGDKVYLLTRNWKMKKPKTKKLDNIKVRLFLVEEKTGLVNIKIQLPRDARVHPNFHISMIEPADQSTLLQETFHYQPEEEQEFEVEQILARKASSATVSAGAGLNSSACKRDVSMTDQVKSSLSDSISFTKHWSFCFAQTLVPSNTFHFRDRQACTVASCSKSASRVALSVATSSQRLSWDMSRDSQNTETQDLPRWVHTAHFNLSSSPSIWKHRQPRRTQKSQGVHETKPWLQIWAASWVRLTVARDFGGMTRFHQDDDR